MKKSKKITPEAGVALTNVLRGIQFWKRATSIYLSYKVTQAHAHIMNMTGRNDDFINENIWKPHNINTGNRMYSLCSDLRGFYVKAGQFLGTRTDFIPEEICFELSRLHDQVPPMPSKKVESLLKSELNIENLKDVFEEINLDKPLGSASIAQVHKAKLIMSSECKINNSSKNNDKEIYKNFNYDDKIEIKNGYVAVKVQYPDASEIMKQDLNNLRKWGAFLSQTELKFDLVSAVNELQNQIELEFDFIREAKVMNRISSDLKSLKNKIEVPKSIPGLVTRKVLVMTFVEGIPLRELGEKTRNLSKRKQRKAKMMILERLCMAYGKMILDTGLFQADGHPGNILVQQGAKIGLLDYGQSKQLDNELKLKLAKLYLHINKGNEEEVKKSLKELGIIVETDDNAIWHKMAIGMFDTKGRVTPFEEDSILKTAPITNFPSELFFVLRVVQLIRGIKQGMEINPEFSCARKWKKYAKKALR